VVEQDGRINVVDSDGTVHTLPFLDINPRVNSSGNEQGLLGLAFDPDYKTNGYFYVNYTNNSGNTTISRFNVMASDSNLANSLSEVIVLVIPQPYSNHNGGCIQFGPDGYLYIGMGDGGSGGDPGNRAQNLDSLLGKMLRIDVNGGSPYAIPSDNPFVSVPNARDEVWAYGLRNPWRFSFDRLTGDMWIADVGQNSWEEVDFQKAGIGGINYGWRCYEGNHGFNTLGCQAMSNYEPAIYELSHSGSFCSITGGYIYRGATYNEMFGYYFFSDFCNSLIQVLKRDTSGTVQQYNTIQFPSAGISSFGEDQYGELYVMDLYSGAIKKIVATNCIPVAYISDKDTLSVCADSILLSTPYNPDLFYSWQTPTGTGSTSTYQATVTGWYKVTVVNASACFNNDSVYVKINGFPAAASFTGLDSTYCSNLSPADSLTGNPPGGIFSGPGINGNLFQPSSSGNGTFEITYLYTDSNGCNSSASQSVTVSTCIGINQNQSSVFNITGSSTASGNLEIRLESKYRGGVKYTLNDISGRQLYSSQGVVNTGEQVVLLPVRAYSGFYFLTIDNGESRVIYRFAWGY
jgi:hypothetical protein